MIGDVDALPAQIDLAIVGAGPAGIAAAATAGRLGASVLMLDENSGIGGQIYRGITTNPVTNKTLLGADYWRGETLAAELAGSSALHAAGATVWSVAPLVDEPGYELGVSIAGRSRMIAAREVILATGALERPFPIPGWTLPGVMSCGGAQTALKASGLVPEGSVVVAGSGPLLWFIAWQYLNAGVSISAILDTTPRANWLSALAHLPSFLASPYLAKGLKLMLAVRAKVRVVSGIEALRAEGTDKVEAVVYTSGGREHRLAASMLLLHQGVVPSINLSNAMGCRHVWDDVQLTWKPETDAWGATSMPGVAVAGDGAGIAGAEAAAERGRIAALGAAHRLGKLDAAKRDRAAVVPRAVLARFERGRLFLDTLYRPAKSFRVPQGDTIVCRCEEVTAERIRETVPLGATGPNQMKSFLRCGMGPCQGRLCGLTVAELIADLRGVSPQDVGYYRLRPPVKPITLGELAAMPKTVASVKAVVRV